MIRTFSFFFSRNNLHKMFVHSYLFVWISAYNYFYMIEIIRAARSIIPAIELTFLSLHMHLYPKTLYGLRGRQTLFFSNACISATRRATMFAWHRINRKLSEVSYSFFSPLGIAVSPSEANSQLFLDKLFIKCNSQM